MIQYVFTFLYKITTKQNMCLVPDLCSRQFQFSFFVDGISNVILTSKTL